MKVNIQIILVIIVSTCQAQISYIRREGDYYRDYEPLKEMMMRYQIENSVDPNVQTLLVHYRPELRTYYVPHFDRKLTRQSYLLRQQAAAAYDHDESAEDEYRLGKVDEDTLSQLPEDDRLLLESQLSQPERQYLLSELEAGHFDTVLSQDRFGMPSYDVITTAIEKIGAGAGQYIGGKLAGDIGAKLGASAGAYLGVAAANSLTRKKEDNKIKDAPSKSSLNFGGSYGYGGGYGAMLLKTD